MIQPNDISTDENLARRVLVRARYIAPCIDSLDEEATKNAIAILKGVIAEIPAPGTRRVRTRSRNGTSISYADSGSWFDAETSADLRSLCASSSFPGQPVGSFPVERPFERIWPEGEYS